MEDQVKIAIGDLKKLIKKLDEISNDVFVNVLFVDNMVISFKDKYQSQIEVTLFEESRMLPKIRKEDIL